MKVFSKKKFIEVEGEQEYERCKVWVDKIDGKEVIKHVIDCYIVYDVWCVNTNEEDYQFSETTVKMDKENINHIAEELTDCYVMLEQFRRYYEISNEEIVKIMKEKIDRQLTRIESEMKNK